MSSGSRTSRCSRRPIPPDVRILSYNIRHGGAGRERALAAVVARTSADVVILQEATDPRVVEQLARDTGMTQWASRTGYSLGVISRRPLQVSEWRWTASARHAYLDLVLEGSTLRIVGVHLRAIHSNWTERRRTQDIAALLRSLAPARDAPHVLVGDFNSLAPAEPLALRKLPLRLRPFVWLSGGTIRWQVVEQLLDAGYVDAYRRLHSTQQGWTFPSWSPHLRLDYAFVPDALAERVRRCDVMTDGSDLVTASDHLPLQVELDDA
jgi:endonuclease/exonuclease/phosphatase family metal-dependent hydrolase